MGLFTLTAGMKSLLKQWGTVRAAASQRLGTANLRQALTTLEVFTAPGETEPTWGELQQVYGLAVANRTAAERLNKAGPTVAMNASLWGLSPNARTPTAMATEPQWELRVHYLATSTGETYDGWATLKFSGQLPATVGTLVVAASATVATVISTPTSTYPGAGGSLSAILDLTLTAL